jgi:hypothetical protein
MLLHAIVFNAPLPATVERFSQTVDLPDCGFGSTARLRLELTEAPEFCAALLAEDDGIRGWIVGEFEDGTPALLALDSEGETGLFHRPLGAIAYDGSYSD